MFIVLEFFDEDHVNIMCSDDDGNTRYFNTYKEAEDFMKKECQIGQVVRVNKVWM
jgi:hypothetical protein